MKRLSVFVVAILVLSALLSACGGGAASDPAGVVKDMMQAVTQKDLNKVADFACAAQKDQIKNAFNPAGAFNVPGMDVQKVLDAMTIGFSNAEYNKVSESGDKASVQVKGKMTITIDKEKFKGIFAAVLKAQGQDATDQMVSGLIDQFATQFEQGQDVNNTVNLVKENGKWVVCQ